MTNAAKPLKWRKPVGFPHDDADALCVADGIGGQYTIDRPNSFGVTLWWANDAFDHKQCKDVADAKAVAEADWQKRYASLAVRGAS